MSMESELAAYIASQIPALTHGTNLFHYTLPDTDDAAYCIRLTSGESDNEAPIELPTFQIMARGAKNDINTPFDQITEIYNLLIPVQRCIQSLSTEITTTNWRFMMFRSIQSPSPLGMDDRDRPLYVFNVEANVVASS